MAGGRGGGAAATDGGRSHGDNTRGRGGGDHLRRGLGNSALGGAGGLLASTHAGQAVLLALCSLVAFYYTGLYDLRTVPSFGQSAHRLLRALAAAFVPAALAQILFAPPTTSYGPLVSSVLIATLLVVIVRASAYQLLDTRPLLERVLVVGRLLAGGRAR